MRTNVIIGLTLLFLGSLLGVQALGGRDSILLHDSEEIRAHVRMSRDEPRDPLAELQDDKADGVVPTPTPEPTPPPDPYLGERGVSPATYHLPILMYHYVGENPNPDDTNRDKLSVTPDQFKAQMQYLSAERYTTLSFDTIDDILKGEQTLPDKPIVLTFDDAYIDFYLNAYPILVEFGMTATVFVPTGLVGTEAYMTWPQIEELAGRGVHFQAHSVTHSHLPSISREQLRLELLESKETLAEFTGQSVTWLAYPYGALSGTVVRIAKEVGYVGAVGTWPGVVQSEQYRFNLRRQRVAGAVTLEEFAARL